MKSLSHLENIKIPAANIIYILSIIVWFTFLCYGPKFKIREHNPAMAYIVTILYSILKRKVLYKKALLISSQKEVHDVFSSSNKTNSFKFYYICYK